LSKKAGAAAAKAHGAAAAAAAARRAAADSVPSEAAAAAVRAKACKHKAEEERAVARIRALPFPPELRKITSREGPDAVLRELCELDRQSDPKQSTWFTAISRNYDRFGVLGLQLLQMIFHLFISCARARSDVIYFDLLAQSHQHAL
jgi:hypothetical protein